MPPKAVVEHPDTITVEGDMKPRKYEDVKGSVVLIGNKYYFKHDKERVVKIKRPTGEYRFYRTSSPLIAKSEEGGDYMLKSDMYLTEDGIYLDKNSPNVVMLDKKYYRKAFVVEIDGNLYLKTDPSIVTCSYSGKLFLKGTGKSVSPELYGSVKEVYPKLDIVETAKGPAVKGHCQLILNMETGEETYVHKSQPVSPYKIVSDFQDKTNPQEDRLVYKVINMYQFGTKDVDTGEILAKYVTTFTFAGLGVVEILKCRVDYFTHCYETYIKPRYISKCAELKKQINKNYDDLDELENRAEVFKVITKPFAGKQNIYTANSFKQPVRSAKFAQTGGLQYSFGVEFETSQGLADDAQTLESLHLALVGDRSIGAGEYVTAPMMGNDGIDLLKAITKLLNKYTLVDNRCGLHVHIGSLFKPIVKDGVKQDKPKPKQAPSFDKHFLINSVNLGALIEKELFESMPPSRVPSLYHCHSIRRFAPMTPANYATNMGAYIFGPKENWGKTTEQCPYSLWDFSPYKLSNNYNADTPIGTWQDGRYKWLNLIPSFHNKTHKTIEFRIFPGTTTFEKTYAYLMFSMAFTYVVDNHPELIKPGVRLVDLFESAFPRYPELVSYLSDFYAARKEKFNRTNLYPTNLSFLK